MKIVVLGGVGAMARPAVRDLAESGDISEVVVADIDDKKANRFVQRLDSKKVSVVKLDIHNHDNFIETIKDADAILDGLPHDFTMAVARGMIEAKVSGCCLGVSSYTARELLDMDSQAKEAGITYIFGVGLSPGASTIFAKYLADQMDEAQNVFIDGISLRPLAVSPGLLDTFLMEVPAPKLVYENGKLKEIPPFAGREEVSYPAPFSAGKYVVYSAVHSEVVTIPTTIQGVKNVSVKWGWYTDYTEALKYWYDLGLLSLEPLNVKGKEIIPKDVLVALINRWPVAKDRKRISCVLRVRVIGKKNGRRVEGSMVTPILPLKGEKEMSLARGTGIPASIIVQKVARGVSETGVMAPEACIDPQEFIQEFCTYPGFEIQEYWT